MANEIRKTIESLREFDSVSWYQEMVDELESLLEVNDIQKNGIKGEDIQIHKIEFWAEHEGNKGGIEIGWSCDIGYGTFQYYLDNDGKFNIGDDEFMGIEFAEMVLHKALNIRR